MTKLSEVTGFKKKSDTTAVMSLAMKSTRVTLLPSGMHVIGKE
jgi:hypothetical protein